MRGSGLRTPSLLDSTTCSNSVMISATAFALSALRAMPGPSPDFMLLVMQATRNAAFERNLASFHLCPGIGVGIARIEATDEIFGKAGLRLIAIEGVEGAAEDDPAKVPQHGE